MPRYRLPPVVKRRPGVSLPRRDVAAVGLLGGAVRPLEPAAAFADGPIEASGGAWNATSLMLRAELGGSGEIKDAASFNGNLEPLPWTTFMKTENWPNLTLKASICQMMPDIWVVNIETLLNRIPRHFTLIILIRLIYNCHSSKPLLAWWKKAT